MKGLRFVSIALALLCSRVACESYSKSCFLNYFLKYDLLDNTYQPLSNGEKVDEICMTAINTTINKLRSSTTDSCISEYWNKKFVSETLLKEYLKEQLKTPQKEVKFDDRFKVFKHKAISVTTIMCNNKDVFRPDLRAMMKNGRVQKHAKAKEIDCLSKYIYGMKQNVKLDPDCARTVETIRNEFYKVMERDTQRAFAPPNDKLVNLKCLKEKADKTQLFEKISFFVVLAANKNMTDNQIDNMFRNAEGVVNGSNKMIYECMI